MSNAFFASVWQHYHLLWSLYTAVAVMAATVLANQLAMLVPVFKANSKLNRDTFNEKMTKPFYAANQAWNRKWAMSYLVVVYGVLMPFSVTLGFQPWWKMLIDMVVILMVYDFVYYLTHRFLFHKKPLLWMHAIHHQQHNPCRMDASYIHPLEVAIGLGLYVMTIFVLAQFMGRFSIPTIVITWLAFSDINLHNHNLWNAPDRFPYRYLNYAARMHHNHHAKFTGGNFATISLLYDWMFGSLDNGNGWGKDSKAS